VLLLGTAIPHKNLQALERDIRARIAQWNDDPRPFIWTKTADETLERLAAYLDAFLAQYTRSSRRSAGCVGRRA
jgi:hypothetical protein